MKQSKLKKKNDNDTKKLIKSEDYYVRAQVEVEEAYYSIAKKGR